MPIGFQERYYSLVDINFLTGKRRVLACLAAGGTMVFARPTTPLASIIDYLGVDHVSLVPNHAELILHDIIEKIVRFPRLKSLVVGGSPVSEDLRFRLRNYITPNTYVACGANEFGEAVIADPEVQRMHPGAIGRPMPGVEVKIVDGENKEQQSGETGMVLWKATGRFVSYLNEPDATAKALHEGWFCPGDLGALTADGVLIYKGRLDDMMIRNGVNIYPREIEHVLESHQDVIEAAAFPVLSKNQAQIPLAAVTLRSGTVTPQQLLAFCQESLGPKAPVKIFIVPAMPRNLAGKIVKGELVKLVG